MTRTLGSRARRALIAVLLLIFAAPLFYLAAQWVPSINPTSSVLSNVPRLGTSPISIVPGVSMLGGLQPSVAYVIETSAGLILIDSGLESDARSVRSQMATLGLDEKRIVAIFLTHTHGDHTGGAEFLRTLAKAKVYAGRDDAPILQAGTPREAFFSTFYMPGRNPHPTSVDVSLSGDETLTFGEVSVHAIATPGHTPGSVCYLVERDGLRLFFSGDVIMKLVGEEKPRYELDKPLGTYSAYLAPRYRGNPQDYLATLRRLKTLRSPDLLLPGHPSADPSPQSPVLAIGRWESILDGGIRDMETLIARRSKDGANFLDGEPKMLLPGVYYLGDFQSSAIYMFFISSKSFLVDAPGGAGLLKFVRDRLRRLGREPVNPDVVLLTGSDAAETAGLVELLRQTQAEVVAPPTGLDRIRQICPPGTTISSAEDVTRRGWFAGRTIPLRGRGSSPIAYELTFEGKTVLFTGRILARVNQETGVALFEDIRNGRGDLDDYLGSLSLLRTQKPNVWLPMLPIDAQNANLYDNEWERDLDDLRQAIQRNRAALGRPGL